MEINGGINLYSCISMLVPVWARLEYHTIFEGVVGRKNKVYVHMGVKYLSI